MEPGRHLLDYLHRRRAEMTDLLARLVRAESPSVVPSAQVAVQTLLSDALVRRGYRVRRVPGRRTGGHLLARPAGGRSARPAQLLLGHCDTVWPLGTLERMPVEVRDGRLYGPGAFDMKAGLVAILFALEALAAQGATPELAPVVFVNSDEEIGSPESTRHIERLARACQRVFVLEPALGPEGRLKTARKGVGEFTVQVRGRASHAGLDPERGASAILELARVVPEIFALGRPRRGITVNVGTIEGGIAPNVVAPEARARVDVRVLRPEDGEGVERALRALRPATPGTEIAVEGGFDRPPMVPTPGSRRLWHLAREAAAELGFELLEGTAGGASDGNTTSRHAPTLDGLGAVGDGAHAPHEHVDLERLVERTALLARLLVAPALHPP